jgi:hypothetical protein
MSKFIVSKAKILNKGSLIGAFDLEMPSGLIVRGMMLFESNGRRWVNFPSKEFVKPDGSRGYYPLLEFTTKEVENNFQKQALVVVGEAFRAVEPVPAPVTIDDCGF